MALSGYLSEYSLAEVFQSIQQGYKTGLLSIIPDHDSVHVPEPESYIWFQSGRIMAYSKNLNSLELLEIIHKRQWIDANTLEDLVKQAKFIRKPLGLHLKSIGVLEAEQLRLLFHVQVLQPVCLLFKLSNARFSFNEKAPLGYLEMTGMSVAAVEASLLGLRVLRDWRALEHKLPEPSFGLQKIRPTLPSFKLDTQELQVWQLANGTKNLADIAQEIELPFAKVQQIAFRLTAVGLVQEVNIDEQTVYDLDTETPAEDIEPDYAADTPSSFLNNLVGFLTKPL